MGISKPRPIKPKFSPWLEAVGRLAEVKAKRFKIKSETSSDAASFKSGSLLLRLKTTQHLVSYTVCFPSPSGVPWFPLSRHTLLLHRPCGCSFTLWSTNKFLVVALQLAGPLFVLQKTIQACVCVQLDWRVTEFFEISNWHQDFCEKNMLMTKSYWPVLQLTHYYVSQAIDRWWDVFCNTDVILGQGMRMLA